MTRWRLRILGCWAFMIAGIITVDVANDDYWGEAIAGLLFVISFAFVPKPPPPRWMDKL